MLKVYKLQVAIVPPNIDKEILIISDLDIDYVRKKAMLIITETVSLDNINTLSIVSLEPVVKYKHYGIIIQLALIKAIKLITPNLIPILTNAYALQIPIKTELIIGDNVEFNIEEDGSIHIY